MPALSNQIRETVAFIVIPRFVRWFCLEESYVAARLSAEPTKSTSVQGRDRGRNLWALISTCRLGECEKPNEASPAPRRPLR